MAGVPAKPIHHIIIYAISASSFCEQFGLIRQVVVGFMTLSQRLERPTMPSNYTSLLHQISTISVHKNAWDRYNIIPRWCKLIITAAIDHPFLSLQMVLTDRWDCQVSQTSFSPSHTCPWIESAVLTLMVVKGNHVCAVVVLEIPANNINERLHVSGPPLSCICPWIDLIVLIRMVISVTSLSGGSSGKLSMIFICYLASLQESSHVCRLQLPIYECVWLNCTVCVVVVSAMYIVWCLQHNYSMQTKVQLAWCANMESLCYPNTV